MFFRYVPGENNCRAQSAVAPLKPYLNGERSFVKVSDLSSRLVTAQYFSVLAAAVWLVLQPLVSQFVLPLCPGKVLGFAGSGREGFIVQIAQAPLP